MNELISYDIRYRVLGTLELRDGTQWIGLQRTKWRTLLAVLLCDENQVFSADRLIEQLWGDEPPQTASKLLQGYVSHLRRILGDAAGQLLVTHMQGYRAHGYQLIVRPGELDSHRFEQLVDGGRAALDAAEHEVASALIDEALSQWRGEPFADVPMAPAVQAKTARLHNTRLQAQEIRVEAEMRRGRHNAVIGELEALIAEYPFHEGFRAHHMMALYRAGRQAEAFETYHDVRRLLVEELGVEPSPSLQILQQRILTADPTLLVPEQSGLRI